MILPNYAAGIKALRTRHGTSQVGFAAALGVDKSHISMLEAGKRYPSTLLLERIGELLHMKVSAIIAVCEESRS